VGDPSEFRTCAFVEEHHDAGLNQLKHGGYGASGVDALNYSRDYYRWFQCLGSGPSTS